MRLDTAIHIFEELAAVCPFPFIIGIREVAANVSGSNRAEQGIT
ncbi:Uncharacterised protein [Vibrio cholerae]|nr:Uncharacterised protein [Vibrio cholerae]